MSECGVLDKNVEGYEEFTSLIDNIQKSVRPVFILFRGSNNEKGLSWCPDCVKAEPIIKQVLDSLDKKEMGAFIQVSVGNRDQWKDPKCPFRTDPRIQISCIPTVIKWNGGRIADEECSKQDVLTNFFQNKS